MIDLIPGTITIESVGLVSAARIAYDALTTNQKGTLETVRGRGVMGVEPVLDQFFPAYQYSSHVSLQVFFEKKYK